MSARFSLLLALLVAGVNHTGLADDAGDATFAPVTYKVDRYKPVWEKHPFIVETKDVTISPTLASKYGLVGILSVGKTPMVFLVDRNETDPNKNRFTVTQGGANSRNIELVSVSLDRDPRKSSVVIKQGQDQTPLPFDTSTLPPTGPVGAGPVPGVPPTPGYYPQPAYGAVPPPPSGMTPNGNSNIVRIGGAPGQIFPNSPNPNNPVNQTGQVPPTPTRRIIRPKPINVN